jgi:hypothetical protein
VSPAASKARRRATGALAIGCPVIALSLLAPFVLVMLRFSAPSGRPGLWLVLLATAVTAQTALAEYAAWSAPQFVGREEIRAEKPPGASQSYQQSMYRPVDPRPLDLPAVAIDFRADGRAKGPDVPPGRTTVGSNLVSRFVRVCPPWRLGGTDADGKAVLIRAAGLATAPVAEPAHPWPVVLGTALSRTALGILATGGILLSARRVSRGHA